MIFVGIDYPVKISQIPKFEKQNEIRINVFGYDEKEKYTHIFPRYVSDFDFNTTVNLLLISNGVQSHYILIKSLNSLLQNKTKHLGSQFCERCLQSFSTKHLLASHKELCSKKQIQKTIMPTDPTLNFINFKYMEPNTVTIYADFEALLVPHNEVIGQKTQLTHKHIPCSYGYIVCSPHEHLNKPVKIYRGQDCVERFVKDMVNEYLDVKDILNGNVSMVFDNNDKVEFESSTTCRICHDKLNWIDNKNCVVRDHCHVSGKFRSAVHNECNLKMQMQRRLIIIFHNGKGYEHHFLIKHLSSVFSDLSEIEIIADTSEKFTQIKTPLFIFRDSFSHLPYSLSELTENLKKKGEEYFPLVKAAFSKKNHFKAALSKGIYCYDYMTNFSKFDEDIPNVDVFYNSLNDEELSSSEFERLKYMCRIYKISTIGELHDHYLKVKNIFGFSELYNVCTI